MICGNCKARTSDKEEVKACFQHGPSVHRTPGPVVTQPPPEKRPFSTFQHMQPVPTQAEKFGERYVEPTQETYAQRYDRRTKSPDLAFPAAMAWKIPLSPSTGIGYFAARVDDNQPFEFFRVKQPKKGKYAGALVVQTIHGDKLEMFLIIRKDGSHWAVEHKRARFEDALTMVVVDPRHAAQKFGEIKQRCCNCGKGLTDDRSLWYGIGPECEQYRDDIISSVIEEKGEYAGPQGISA